MNIRNIWAVGRNYAEHAKELGNQVPEASGDPMIFLKAGSSAVGNGSTFKLPAFSNDVHHEVEIVLKFGPDLKFSEVTIGIDLTARDLQAKAKAAGHPWTLAKSFSQATLLGDFVSLTQAAGQVDPQNLDFQLKVNGALRQRGNTGDMIHSIEKVRAFVIERFPVVPGDIVMTGTPPGVAQLKAGDVLEAQILAPSIVAQTASWRAQSD